MRSRRIVAIISRPVRMGRDLVSQVFWYKTENQYSVADDDDGYPLVTQKKECSIKAGKIPDPPSR